MPRIARPFSTGPRSASALASGCRWPSRLTVLLTSTAFAILLLCAAAGAIPNRLTAIKQAPVEPKYGDFIDSSQTGVRAFTRSRGLYRLGWRISDGLILS